MSDPTTTIPTSTSTLSTTTATASSTETCIPNMKPGKDGYLPPYSCDALQNYVLSFGAAVLFTVLFGLITGVHIVQAFIYKKRFCWVIIMASIWELAALILRVFLSKHQNNENYYTSNFLLMLLAPLWINAFLYMILGRMVYFLSETKKLVGISAVRLSTIFVLFDIVAFIVQATGAVMASQTDAPNSTIMTGLHIYMGGVGLQQIFILCFTGLAILQHRQTLVQERQGLLYLRFQDSQSRSSMGWRWLFYALYIDLVLITVRVLFPSNSEAYPYVLDTLPMFLALAVLNVLHPGRVLRGPDSEFPRLSRAEKKRVKKEKKAQKATKKAEKRVVSRQQGFESLTESGRESPEFRDSIRLPERRQLEV
ncbi:hypothetical protein MPDQ_006050 [Monascus purpureus]|uniref:RTA1 domain protein n=1 Tax=Monascus purpureus TaxID=5098 RepID=A0A507QVF5_MONPU|nr:hypothetical protein MPDQ_006050 [Monascus purpureus]